MATLIRIALVEDSTIFRKGIRRALEAHSPDYQVVLEAVHGQDFLDQLPATPVDLVLLGVNMPVMDGIDTLLWIKKHQPQIRIIMLTGADSGFVIAKCMLAGANGFLSKYNEPDILFQAIDQVLKNGFWLESHLAAGLSQYFRQPKYQLSAPQSEFLSAIEAHLTYAEIAERMQITVEEVEEIRDELYRVM